MNKEEKLLNKVKETPDNIIEEAIDKTSIDLAKEDLSFMNEGDYITKEMANSADVLEKYIEKLEFNIEASKKEHEYDLNMIDEVKGNAVKLYKENRELKAVLDKVTDKLKELDFRLYLQREENRAVGKDINTIVNVRLDLDEILEIIEGEKE